MATMRLTALTFVLGAVGCAAVPAYDRGILASERMVLEDQTGEGVLVRSRQLIREEGAIGATGGGGGATGGGGCGCQ